MLVPVGFILVPDPVEVDRDRGLPAGALRGIGQSGYLRRKRVRDAGVVDRAGMFQHFRLANDLPEGIRGKKRKFGGALEAFFQPGRNENLAAFDGNRAVLDGAREEIGQIRRAVGQRLHEQR